MSAQTLELRPEPIQQQETIETNLTTIIKNGMKYIVKITKRLTLLRQTIQVTKKVSDAPAMMAMDMASLLDDELELSPAFTTMNMLNSLRRVHHKPRRRFVNIQALEPQNEAELEASNSYRAAEINDQGQEIPLRRVAPRLRPELRLEPRENTSALRQRPAESLMRSQPSISQGLQMAALMTLMMAKGSNIILVTTAFSIPTNTPALSRAAALESLVPALALAFEAHRMAVQAAQLMVQHEASLYNQASSFMSEIHNAFGLAHAPAQIAGGIDNPHHFYAPNPARLPTPRPALELPKNEQRLAALGFPMESEEVKIPSRYKCTMMNSVMDTPVTLPHNPNDKFEATGILRHLQTSKTNPYARGPMTEAEVKADLDLRAEIGSYVDQIEKGVKEKRRELGRNDLSLNDYKAINQAVLDRMPQPQNNEEPAPSASKGPRC